MHVEMAEDHVDIALARRIQAHVRAELVAFKVPRYVQSWRSLPAHTVRADLKNKISDKTVDSGYAIDLGQRGSEPDGSRLPEDGTCQQWQT